MAEATRSPVHTGGCQCGAVRFALYAEPEQVHLCHCRMCQKAVGGPFAALAPVRRSDFAWTRGTPARFVSSSVAERHYCVACGTPLAFAYVTSAWIDPTIGSFDDPGKVIPTHQYGIESRHAWLDSAIKAPGKPTTEGVSTGPLVDLVNFQHPDHETPDGWQPPAHPGPSSQPDPDTF